MSIFTLQQLEKWAPFKVDALGLVTILGVKEVDIVIGQLTWNTFTEWLPMLGSYVFANGDITAPLPGFALYNITDGILATDLAGWFSRWLLCQDVTFCSSAVRIQATTTRYHRRLWEQICCCVLGVLNLIPIILGIMMGDWWGVANGMSMLASVAVRQIIICQNRLALDLAVNKSERTSCENIKMLTTFPNGRVVTARTTRGILLDCLLTVPRPPNPKLYKSTRAVGWVIFAIHVISLGMASLFSQILAVILLVMATTFATQQVGTDRSHVGQRLVMDCAESQFSFRAAMYASLDLTPQQEYSMVLWGLFPHMSNKFWWAKYRKAKEQSFAFWDSMLARN